MMCVVVVIGSLTDGIPAVSPLDLGNLEGTLREVKERGTSV